MRLPGATRPVGEPVPVFPRRGAPLAWPAGYDAAWFDRGTTALAIAARALVLAAGRPEPRIVLPAYTCPDVVSAVLWAGAVPVLADTLPGLPWLDEAALQQHHDASWVGVIAPHFLGLRHPLDTLQSWCRSAGVGLIEDSAQLGPRSPAFQPVADLVVLSFGRGKPIPAGGGALLFRGGACRPGAGARRATRGGRRLRTSLASPRANVRPRLDEAGLLAGQVAALA
jgi:hypothetical protein